MARGRETRRHPAPDLRRVFPLVESGLHRVARTTSGDNRQIRRQTPRRGRHARKRGENIPLLSPFLSRHISVALDTGGRIFSAFNVQYVPFGVLVDSRNRALWMGNSLQLTPEIIEKSSK